MGGKGKRRREKNFLASHGGNDRLPPPPKLQELDALPSKLRKLMQIKDQATSPSSSDNKKRNREYADNKKENAKIASESVQLNLGKEDRNREMSTKNLEDKEEDRDSKKRKRKRKTVQDLRFTELEKAAAPSRRKERKKEYFELKKKKKKQKKEMADDIHNFPGQEKINFGEIVEAPPKLSFHKASKSQMDASKERLRLQAIEAYRNRKGWASRLGAKLPALAETLSQ